MTPRQRRASGGAGRGAEDSEKAAVVKAPGTGEKEKERGRRGDDELRGVVVGFLAWATEQWEP